MDRRFFYPEKAYFGDKKNKYRIKRSGGCQNALDLKYDFFAAFERMQ